MSMKKKTTARGFEYVEFTDSNDMKCSIQQSSAVDMDSEDGIDHPGSSKIWLGIDEIVPVKLVPGYGWQVIPMEEGVKLSARMHLTRPQAAQIVLQLQSWLDKGEFI